MRKEKGRFLAFRMHQARIGSFSWHTAEDSSGTGTNAYLSQVLSAGKPESLT